MDTQLMENTKFLNTEAHYYLALSFNVESY